MGGRGSAGGGSRASSTRAEDRAEQRWLAERPERLFAALRGGTIGGPVLDREVVDLVAATRPDLVGKKARGMNGIGLVANNNSQLW